MILNILIILAAIFVFIQGYVVVTWPDPETSKTPLILLDVSLLALLIFLVAKGVSMWGSLSILA